MKITVALKNWLIENGKATVDQDEGAYRKATADALLDETLSNEKFAELTKDPDADAADVLGDTLKQVCVTLKLFGDRIDTMEAGHKKERSALDKHLAKAETTDTDVRVVGAHEQYSHTKSDAIYPQYTTKGMRHPFGGQRVRDGERLIQDPSELERAIHGAWVKLSIRGTADLPRKMRLTDHDRGLLMWAADNCDWVETGDEAVSTTRFKLGAQRMKAVLDDASSGGLEAAPITFDDAAILTPLLYGELYPKVNVINIARGRRVEGVTVGNVTLGASTEGSAVSLFNTTNFIAAFDTTIFVCAGAIEIGLDFLSDSPIDIAGVVTKTYGEQLMTWLDTQIASGDGTTEPEGINTASGTTTVNASNGATGPWTVGDLEALLFGVTKQYKAGTPSDRIVFCGTETTYRRIRGIAVGATDARRVFGMTHEDYKVFDHPFAINAGLTNRMVFFANLARYRMYRRQGLMLKAETQGSTLARANEMLIVARARFGGQLESGSAAAYCSDGQS